VRLCGHVIIIHNHGHNPVATYAYFYAAVPCTPPSSFWSLEHKRASSEGDFISMQYAEVKLETLQEEFDVPVFVAGESFLFCGWSLSPSPNTNALTVQQPPPRCQRIGPLGAPCGYTHGWGRRNGTLGSPSGSFVFLVPYYESE